MSRTRSPAGDPWTADTLSREVSNQPYNVTVSRTYIYNLLNGKQANPSVTVIEALAGALHTPASYFLASTPDDLDYATWRESEEAEYFLRVIMDMSSERRGALLTLAEHYRTLEGLPQVVYSRHDDRSIAPAQRTWRSRFARKANSLSPEEVAEQIVRSMRAPDEER